jgi:hypothetical protein
MTVIRFEDRLVLSPQAQARHVRRRDANHLARLQWYAWSRFMKVAFNRLATGGRNPKREEYWFAAVEQTAHLQRTLEAEQRVGA